MGNPGETIIFFEKGDVKIGKVKYKEGKNVFVILPDGTEKIISEVQILKSFAISDLQKVKEIRDDIDLKVLWEVVSSVPDIKDISLEELLQIYNPHFQEEEIAALLLKLYSKENIYFKHAGEEKWIPRSEKDVQNLYQMKKEIEEKRKLIEQFRKWIFQPDISKRIKLLKETNIKTFFSENYPLFGEGIPDVVSDVLSKVKEFFVKGKNEKFVKEALSGIVDIKREEIFKFLVFFGMLKPYENFFTEKFELNFSDKEIKISFDYGNREKIEDRTYSIDIEGTEIRDDAISDPMFFQDTTEILVHIADVSLVDNPHIIQEVIKRGKTMYFPEGKSDMLPGDIAKHLSLDAGEPKPAITFRIKFSTQNDKIQIKDVDVLKSEIIVKENYEFSHDVDVLQKIKKVGLDLYNIRVFRSGGVDLISSDFLILIDEKGNFKTQKWDVNDMRIVVAEISMLCAYGIGWFCAKNNIPVFFRKSKIDEATKSYIQNFNKEAKEGNFPRPYVIWKNIRASRYIETTLEPSGAESLGYELYAWGTSPIRRGWDFINIIQIARFIEGKKLFSKEELSKIKERLEKAISRVEAAEDSRYRYILAIYILRELSGKEIPALVVEKGKDTVYWIEDILSFIKGKNPKKADVLDYVNVRLISDPVNLKITAVPIE